MPWPARTLCLREGEQLSDLEQLLERVRPLHEFDTREEVAVLAELGRGRMVLEVGTWKGASAITFALAGALQVHCIEWFRGGPGLDPGDSLAVCWANLERYGVRDKVTLHIGDSRRLLPMMPPRIWDLVFIDGDHDAALTDTAAAVMLLARGGVIAWHDSGGWKVDEGPAYVATLGGWRIERPAGTLVVAYAP